MAYITLNRQKLKTNYTKLNRLFKEKDINWAIVGKVLCGNRLYLQELIGLGIGQICDSRIEHLKTIKSIAPSIETIFIKPPAKRNAAKVVAYADISFNTEYETIKLLSEAATAQNKMHKIIIMIELGELREGVMREQFVAFYKQVFDLPNIEVVGIGTNLTCMYGVLPSQDKLMQLCLYKELVEVKFNKQIDFISGGASVTIPLIDKGELPAGVNHFRVGETLFLGTDVYNSRPYSQLHQDVFRLYAEIIEVNEKPRLPNGEMGQNLAGHMPEFDEEPSGATSVRAIVDLGLLDVEQGHIEPVDGNVTIGGASSDMIVVDLVENHKGYRVGDHIEFSMDYMGLLRLMSSEYIDKRFEENDAAGKRLEKISLGLEPAVCN